MTPLEIILLLIGVLCVAVSFIFFMKVDGPEKKQDVNVKLSEQQKEDIKTQIASVFREQTSIMAQTVEDKTRDSLEKLSNQKINEFAEYSDTVLGEINKSHTEVMFLYDMLTEKNKEVRNSIRDLQNAARKSEEKTSAGKNISDTQAQQLLEKKFAERTEAAVTLAPPPPKPPETVKMEPSDENMDSKRETVLRMLKEGKSEVEIAKALGIGVGEVRLVIGLFKGTK